MASGELPDMMTADPNDPLRTEGRAMSDLPWFITGTLADEDRRAMVAALKRQPALIDALDAEIQMRRAVRGIAESVNTTGGTGFDALMARIDIETAAAGGAEGLSSLPVPAAAEPRPARRTGRTRWLALAAVVALTLQAGTLALLLDGRQDGAAAYRTASAPTPVASAATIQASVIFADQVTIGHIRATLDAMDARIANGPMPDGAFILDLAAADDLAALQARPDLVRRAERVR